MRAMAALMTNGQADTSYEMVPISDIVNTDWLEGAGDANGNAFEELDDGRQNPDGSTTWWYANNSGATLRLNMTSRATAPVTPSAVHIRMQGRASSGTITTAKILIYEGGTLRATATYSSLFTSSGWSTSDQVVDLSSVVAWTDINFYVEHTSFTPDAGDLQVSMVSLDQY